MPVKRSPLVYGNSSSNLEIVLSNLDCRGTESSLLDCPVNTHNGRIRECDHSEEAGVRCGGSLSFSSYNNDYKLCSIQPYYLQLFVRTVMYD